MLYFYVVLEGWAERKQRKNIRKLSFLCRRVAGLALTRPLPLVDMTRVFRGTRNGILYVFYVFQYCRKNNGKLKKKRKAAWKNYGMGLGVHQQEFLYFPRAVDKNCIQPKKAKENKRKSGSRGWDEDRSGLKNERSTKGELEGSSIAPSLLYNSHFFRSLVC